jgi:hypothetical protein
MTSCSTNVCGVGGWNGPLPGDPDNFSTLTATTVFGGINVAWTYPATNPHAVAHVLLYRSLSSNFNLAVLLSTVGGNRFYDQITVTAPTEYFYWIRIVSVNATVGELIGPASAIATSSIEDTIESLTGRIDQGVLAQSLKTDIDRITLNYAELTGEIANRIASNNALSLALAQVQAGVTESLGLINEEITIRQEGDSALAQQVNVIAAVNANNAAAIIAEQTARVDEDSSLSNRMTLLAATAGSKASTYSQPDAPSAITNTLASGDLWFDTDDSNKTYRWDGVSWQLAADNRILVTAAALTAEETARANGDSALASQITTSQSTLNANIASVQTTLQTNINTVDGKVTQIGALYTAKVSVNGLVGGFGIYNNGTEVEAGFDVDRFWIGRTQANKRKPFIVQNGVVYIDKAAIVELSANIVRADNIISRSATSFQQSTFSVQNGVWGQASFFMDHYGYVAVICNCNFTFSATDASWEASLGIDNNVAFAGMNGSYYSSAGPPSIGLMTAGWYDQGWHTVNVRIYHSGATGLHQAHTTILRSYR